MSDHRERTWSEPSRNTQLPENLLNYGDCAIKYLSNETWSSRYPANVFTLDIPSYSRSPEDSSIVYYNIRIYIEDAHMYVKRRYSEFDQLRKDLMKKEYMKPYTNQVPELPEKGWTRPTDDETLQYRREGLERFLQEILRLPPVTMLAIVRQFLNLPYPDRHEQELKKEPDQAIF